MKTYSQVNQDLFVLSLIKTPGFFVDFGAGWDNSGINSNTLMLEENGWTGICVDGNIESANKRKERSINSTVLNVFIPQTKIIDILKNNNSPKVIDYISVDIDPSSIIVLDTFPFDEYEFKVMTFEHDAYRNGTLQKDLSKEILNKKGYICLCDNVNVPEEMGIGLYFEDWWVNPKYFSLEFIENNKFNNSKSIDILNNIKLL